ncbi:MAG: heme-binding protein [Coprobacillaceae bacterium]
MNKEIVLKQEKELQFQKFMYVDAWNLTEIIINNVKSNYEKPVGVRIVYNDVVVMHYLMDGKRDSDWLERKVKTVLESNHCSLYTFLTMDENPIFEKWSSDEQYAICGGGFPIIEEGVVKGAICVSGLAHLDDHEVLINALDSYLNKKMSI